MPQLLFSGLPGKMCAEVLLAAQHHPEFCTAIHPRGLTGAHNHGSFTQGNDTLELLSPAQREAAEWPAGLMAVDYSVPEAALANVGFYVTRGIPFVMGTTGFDRAEAVKLVAAGSVPALIAPNMGIPIILIQRALAQLAADYPNALSGYSISITESHQSTKKDTSGTAKALVKDFAALGLPATVEAIEQVRDAARQQSEFHVPVEFLTGHAYHYYRVASPDQSVRLELSHCIHGRRVYAEGTLKAVEFLARKQAEGVGGVCYSMEDVLRDLK